MLDAAISSSLFPCYWMRSQPAKCGNRFRSAIPANCPPVRSTVSHRPVTGRQCRSQQRILHNTWRVHIIRHTAQHPCDHTAFWTQPAEPAYTANSKELPEVGQSNGRIYGREQGGLGGFLFLLQRFVKKRAREALRAHTHVHVCVCVCPEHVYSYPTAPPACYPSFIINTGYGPQRFSKRGATSHALAARGRSHARF